jgi:hydrogenase maturation protein HypF
VGLRPYVWRLAKELGLSGSVENSGSAVEIRIFGAQEALAEFRQKLLTELPPAARIAKLEAEPVYEPKPAGFVIRASAPRTPAPFILPDVASCRECCAEILDLKARRYRYPFTSCTHCGPRFSVIYQVPYDRERTSFGALTPCQDCLAEYKNPSDRRFHAQTIACPRCGPSVWLEPGEARGEEALEQAVLHLRQGKILAVKGLGGFQLLACAFPPTIARLRQRKQRPHKPLALMARDLEVVRRYVRLSLEEEQALLAKSAPIVLLAASDSLPGIAEGLDSLGFVLPYTPLHHLLLAEFSHPLVFTSGNLSGDPLCADNAEAKERLAAIADGFLCHDLRIVHPCDDSVVRWLAGKVRVLRRARGMAPAPLPTPCGFEAADGILALGGELKSSFALMGQGQIVLSQYLGDLEQALSFARYQKELAAYLELFAFSPRHVAVDLHPEYLASKLGRSLAKDRHLTLTEVQHHHAHLAAVLAENGHPRDGGPVLGLILDGLGYGADGTLWGGELLYGDYVGYRRLACLEPFPLLGGTKAMREPWRNLASQLWQAGVEAEVFPELAAKPWPQILKLLETGLNSPLASSCGRLFDAVAAALGLCFEKQTYEGQAAAELEALAWRSDDLKAYLFTIAPGKPWRLSPAKMWPELIVDLKRGVPKEIIARRFHLGLVRGWRELIGYFAQTLNCATVALSGGVFQNRLLLEELALALAELGISVLLPEQIPMNDQGLAVGQAVIAAAQER